jgi:ubiquinone/menaquinone biosynthesis C-methylase UbiE
MMTADSPKTQNKQLLVVGEGRGTRPDAITVDINPRLNPDVIHNLETVPWPFKDNHFKSIVCHHILEHLQNFTEVMNELHRICEAGGTIWIQVPHFSSRYAHSPGHVFSFNVESFDPYITEANFNWGHNWVDTDKRFKCLRRKITFHRVYRQLFLHKLFNRFPQTYERFWTYLFPAEHFEIELQPIK